RCMFALAFFSAFAREHPTSPLFPYTTLFRSDDEQARYIEASFSGGTGEEVRVGSLYLPNGNPIGTDKFTYKLAWMERLHDRAERSEEHTSELQSPDHLVCRLLLEKKKNNSK